MNSAHEAIINEKRDDGRLGVTVVVPCCNEADALPHLAERLAALRQTVEQEYELSFVFIDDGSTDSTGAGLRSYFGHWPRCQVITHPRNRGIAAAIRTGVEHAPSEIVCSLDSDCTYDPLALGHMVPLLTPGVDLVTASPYHPSGSVQNVPAWRLALSRTASQLYRSLLRNKLYTYTSCFRVYRKSAVLDLPVKRQRFDGIAELLARLDYRGARIVEYPATLKSRRAGQSKLRLLATIKGHLVLLAELVMLRLSLRLGFHQARTPSSLPLAVNRTEKSSLKRIPA